MVEKEESSTIMKLTAVSVYPVYQDLDFLESFALPDSVQPAELPR